MPEWKKQLLGHSSQHSYTLAGTPAWTWRSWTPNPLPERSAALWLCLSPAEPEGKRNQGESSPLPSPAQQLSHPTAWQPLAASASGTAAAAAGTEPESSCGMGRAQSTIHNPQFTVLVRTCTCSAAATETDPQAARILRIGSPKPGEMRLLRGQDRASSNTCCSAREWSRKRQS